MNAENLKVLTNIIGAVESGGQVYRQRRYDAYAGPYTNTSNEHTITLGWAQNYGDEARKLIQMIYKEDPAEFLDIEEGASPLISSMLSKDWVGMRWNPNESQKKALIRLISSETGKECQDRLFMDLMKQFISDCSKDYTDNEPAQMMYCEIRHLGDKKAADRIFKRCGGDYSLDNIMAALKKDQSDTSSSNQVGDKLFWSRHQKCVEFIRAYADVDEEEQEDAEMPKYTADAVIAEAAKWEGYLEKAGTGTDEQLKSKKWNAGSANITWFWRWHERNGTLSGLQGGAWCDGFVDYCHAVVAGIEKAAKSLNGFSAYTPDSAARYKAAGRWIPKTGTPKRGDQIFFEGYVSSEGQHRIKHTGIVDEVTSTKVYTWEGNTSSAAGVVANGGCVRRKCYDRNDPAIAGYGRPLYDAAEDDNGGGYMFTVNNVSKGTSGNSVLLCQEILKARGYKGKDGKELSLDGECGDNTVYAINAYQSARRKQGVELGTNGKNDGCCGSDMWKDLLGL